MLGGASLIILPLAAFLLPVDDFKPIVASVMLLLANFINHPHFASSYQIFYRNFREKLFGAERPAGLRSRYFVAGLVVPAVLVGFFGIGTMTSDALLVGRAVNLMAFLVGWHYVKQGYGMLMVDAVLKRNFFSAVEKKVLISNSYACWLATWMFGNREAEAHDYLSLEYYTFDIPDAFFYAAALTAAATTALVLAGFARRYFRNSSGAIKGLPFNGAVAYLTSVYLWMMFVASNLLMILIVPAFHSVQYLFVVSRYQINLENSRLDGRVSPEGRPFGRYFRDLASYRLTLFGLGALALGYLGFWGAPEMLGSIVSYDREVFGPSLFLFMFWIFINVHHYFMDNVIWKSTNPEVRRYLFSP